jgi:tRNA pseudouridine32 synthase/23S rRNA pseudouridine746 synthase
MKVYRGKVSKYFTKKTSLGEFLQKFTSLQNDMLNKATRYGAVFYQAQGKGKIERLRDLSFKVAPEDLIIFNFDAKVLSLPPFIDPVCLEENPQYGIYFKPAGVMSQGSESGDHTSILRAVELQQKKEVFLVHRLDRETAGLMVIAFKKEAAAKLGELFQRNQVKKIYQAVVLGEMPVGDEQTIKASLDDKEAITHYKVIASGNNQSLLEVRIDTGRLHQIRRHLDFIHHPVMGDPKYGEGNKNRDGLKLLAKTLSFQDPWNKTPRSWSTDVNLTV